MCLLLLLAGISHEVRAQKKCDRKITYHSNGEKKVTNANQGSVSTLGNGSIKIEGVKHDDKSKDKVLTYSSDKPIVIVKGEFTGHTSILGHEPVIHNFEASEYYDFRTVNLNWSLSDIFTELKYGNAILPKVFFTRKAKPNGNLLALPCVNFNDLTYTDKALGNGGKYEYCAQSYATDQHGSIVRMAARACDIGETDMFQIIADNNKSDAEIQIQWSIDANCLKGPKDEDVFFQVKDLTSGKEVYTQTIEDPSAYLYFGTFKSDYSRNFNGINSRVDLPKYNKAGFNIEGKKSKWTAECWVKISESKTNLSHFIISDQSDRGLYFRYLNDSEASLRYYTYKKDHTDLDIKLPVGKWVHIAVATGAEETKFYVNGIHKASVADLMPWGFDYLGDNTQNRTMNGIIADFRVWDNARSTQEIAYNYLYGLEGDEHSLVAYYKLNEKDATSSTVKDETGRYNATSHHTTITKFIEDTERNEEFHYIITENVHQNEHHNYQLAIFTLNKGKQVCDIISDEAQTAPLAVNTDITTTNDDPGRVKISWDKLKSDWSKGYKVYRREKGSSDWSYLATIQDETTKHYEDFFSFSSDQSIKIGTEYEYQIKAINDKYGEIEFAKTPTGKTLSYALKLENKNDSVFISWDDFSSLAPKYDTIKITRDGELLRYTTVKAEALAVDPYPIYGKEHRYGLIFVKNGKDYAGVFETNKLAPNGAISGRILTAIGKYPVVNAEVTLDVEIGGDVYQTTTKTDNLGFYSLKKLFYGKQSDFEVKPNLIGHTFVDKSNNEGSTTITLNRFENTKENVDFFSLREYEVVSNTDHEINNLSVVNTADEVQYFEFKWQNMLKVSSNHTSLDLYFNIYRGDKLISTFVETIKADGDNGIDYAKEISFRDSTASPGKTYDYTVYSYYFEGDNELYSKKTSKQFTWGKVPNYITDFVATADAAKGVVKLSWKNEKHGNCDGYLLERKAQGIDVTETVAVIEDAKATSFTDLENGSGTTFTYYLKPFINNNGSEMVASEKSLDKTVQYPTLAVPSIKIDADSKTGFVTLDGELELNTAKDQYNFDGIKIVRQTADETIEIADLTVEALKQPKSSKFKYIYNVEDKSGVPNAQYTYKVFTYKGTKKGETASTHSKADVQYPDLPTLKLEASNTNGVTALSLEYDLNANIDGVYFLRTTDKFVNSQKAKNVGEIKVGKLKHLDAISSMTNGEYQYKAVPFRIIGDKLYENIPTGYTTVKVSPNNGTLLAPTNLIASNIYDKYVELNWEFPAYMQDAKFVIYRGTQKIGELSSNYRSFKDYNAEFGVEYTYKVRTEMDGEQSSFAVAIGQKTAKHTVSGRIYTHNQLSGINGTEVKMIWYQGKDIIHYINTTSDAAGAYLFEDVPYFSNATSVKVVASKTNHLFSENPLSTTINNYIYSNVDFVDNVIYKDGAKDKYEVTTVNTVSAFADDVAGHVEISWKPQNNNYDGFIIYRDYEPIMKYELHSGNFSIIDTMGTPGHKYIYSVQPYWNSPKGYQEGERVDAPSTVLYPGYAIVTQVKAVPKKTLNHVEVYWSHIGEAAFFEIYRSEELIAVVKQDEQHMIIDTKGIPGLSYKYRVRSYNASTKKYSNFGNTNLIYPELVSPVNFAAKSDDANNEVDLNWSYTGKYIDGFIIFRNGVKLETIENPNQYTWTDETGIPESWHDYEVVAYRKDSRSQYYSEAAKATAFYPEIENVGTITASYPEQLVQLDWNYTPENIEGFYLYRDGKLLATLDKNTTSYLDKYGHPTRNYNYKVVAYDFRGDDLKEYISDEISKSVTYPNYPSFRSHNINKTSSYAKLNWSYDWKHIDGFIINRGSASNNRVAYDTIQSWSREYYDHINTCGITKHYQVRPYRLIDGAYVTSGSVHFARNTTLSGCSSGNNFLKAFTASKGKNKDKVKLNWEYIDGKTVDKVIIKRAVAGGSFQQIAEKNSQWNAFTDEDVVDGQVYQYQIVPKVGTSDKNALTAEGYSQAEGEINGLIQAYQDKSPLAGINVKAFAMIDGIPYSYTAVTDKRGIYNFYNMYIKPGHAVSYTITAQYEDHKFLNNDQNVEISEERNQNTTDKTIYDLQSKTISGYATYANRSKCKLDSVKMTLHYIDALGNSSQENTYTDKDGYYSFIIKSLNDIEKYGIVANGFLNSYSQNVQTWHFEKDSVAFNIDEVEQSLENVNFKDTTAYKVSVDVANGCGMPLGDFGFEIAVESSNGCFYETYTTDASGNLTLKLPPLNYTLRVVNAVPLDINSQPIIDYFRVRPALLDIASIHKDRVSTGLEGTKDTSVVFSFHKVPEIQMTASSFTDASEFECKLEGIHIAKETNGSYSDIQFAVLEEYNGENCPVSGGYIVVKNNAAKGKEKLKQVAYNAETEMFNSYSFSVGDPNPVAPFFHNMSVEYFSENGEFLTDLTEYIIVTGDLGIEGNDVLVIPNRDENKDEIQIPLFVLRDPPGDKSYSYIDKEVGLTKSISAKKSDGVELKLDEEAKIGLFAYNILQDYHAHGESTSSENYNLAFSVKTSEKISTAASPILSINDKAWVNGRNADVVVGLGVALQTGITENVTLVSDKDGTCMALNYLDYKVSTDSISTQWVYTENQIRNIIRNYDDILKEKIGDDYTDQVETQNQTFGHDTMAFYYSWKNWKEMHKYYQLKTLPHYLFCSEKYDPNKSGDVKDFCENFFTFDGNDITGRNTEAGSWSNKWMDIYNAEMQKLNKEYSDFLDDSDWDVLDYDGTGGLFTIQGALNPVNVSNQFAKNQAEAKRVFKEQYTGAGIENITFTGGTKYQKEVSSKIQGKYNYDQYYGFKDYGGVGLKSEIEIKSKTKLGGDAKANAWFFSVGPRASHEVEIAVKTHYALMLKSQRMNKVSFTENAGVTVDSTYKVGYVLSDDDDGDQFSTMVIKGTLPGHTPYFEIIGGRSTCPYEEGTIDRNRIVAKIVDKDGNPTNNAQYNLDPNKPTVFYARISNNNTFGEDLIVDISGMPTGSSETENINKTIYGEKLRPTKRVPLFVPADSSLMVEILVSRNNPMQYDYPNIELLLRPNCEKSPFYGDTLKFAAFFRKPCSNITIAEPESGWVINKAPEDKEENLSMKLMDYTVDRKIFNLDSVVVEYRRQGSNKWNYFMGVTYDELADYYEDYKTVYREPTYPAIWNITNNSEIVDGKYEIRAMAECGTGGYTYSNVISGTVDRTSLKVFKSSPSNGVLSLGDLASVSFNENIDKELLDEEKISIVTAGGNAVPYELFASGSSVTFKIEEDALHSLHDSTLTVTIADVLDQNGNMLEEPYSWSFRVNYSPVFFSPMEIVQSMQAEEVKHIEVNLNTNWESINQFALTGYGEIPWLTLINEYGVEIPDGTIQLFRQGERGINLQFNTESMQPGEYHASISAKVDGYNTAYMDITLRVLSDAVDWTVNTSQFTLSMATIANYKLATETDQIVDGKFVFELSEFSTDTLDMVGAFIDNELRGVANITKITDTRYAAYLTVHANEEDLKKTVKFAVYDASTGIEYDATPDSPVTFEINKVYGTSAEPMPLVANTRTQRVRYIHFCQGWNMFSLNALPEDPTFNAVFAGLDLTNGDIIKGHNDLQLADYNATTKSWLTADVDTITPGNGYWIYLDKANVLRFSGDEASCNGNFYLGNPEGWYLVGSPVQQKKNINSVLGFSKEDISSAIIKSKDEVAEFENNTWLGSLVEIKPFEAYKVNANKSGMLRFSDEMVKKSYQQNKKAVRKSGLSAGIWSIDPSEYEHNQTIVGEVVGGPEISEGDNVIAFDEEGMVRGIGKLSHFPEINKYLVTMLVYGNDTEALDFKYHSASEKLTYDITNDFNFKINERVGKTSDAYLFTVDAGSVKATKENINVYPNPFQDAVIFTLYVEEDTDINVSLSDLQGRTIVGRKMNTTKGVNYLQLDVSGSTITTGVYTLKVVSGGEIIHAIDVIKQ